MPKAVKVVQVGLGSLGRSLTSFLVERPQLKIIAAVDTDPDLIGRDLGDIAGLDGDLGVRVTRDLDISAEDGLLAAVHTTTSSLEAVAPQIGEIVGRGINVVSSCEELSYPWLTAPEISADLDRCARAAGVSILGTGVNPGFLMDFLPTALTAVSRDVRKITVLRYQDATSRRLPFQRKIGAGLTREQFEQRKEEGTLRHVGLTESIHMIASRMGWTLKSTEDIIEPVIAQHRMRSDELSVEPGQASGVYQLGRGFADGEERIRLEFRACLGEEQVQDTVIVEGTPSLRFTAPEGVHGDVATCAILTNAIPVVVDAEPGLRTMVDVPPISFFAR